MSEKIANRFNWWLPFYGSLGAAVVVLPRMILGNDIGTFLGMAVIAAIVGLILLVILFRTIRRQTMAALSMVAVFGAASWLLFRVSDDVHTTGRWLIQSGRYKTEILAQPNPANGELKHAEWDGWGFAGQVTRWCIWFSIRMIRWLLRPKAILPANTAAYPVKFPTSGVWRTTGTQSCSIPTRIGISVAKYSNVQKPRVQIVG